MTITTSAFSQTDSTKRKMSPPDINTGTDSTYQNMDMNHNPNRYLQNHSDSVNKTETYKTSDGVILKNGKMMMIKAGKTTLLDKSITMSNGTKIMTDGSYLMKNGSKMKLNEGDHMDLSGKLTPKHSTLPKTN